MVHLMKNMTVQLNSANLEEARKWTLEFFRLACRSIPSIMEIYNLRDVVSPSHLRSTVPPEIRQNSHVTNPKVIDMLLFKANEELKNFVDHTKAEASRYWPVCCGL